MLERLQHLTKEVSKWFLYERPTQEICSNGRIFTSFPRRRDDVILGRMMMIIDPDFCSRTIALAVLAAYKGKLATGDVRLLPGSYQIQAFKAIDQANSFVGLLLENKMRS